MRRVGQTPLRLALCIMLGVAPLTLAGPSEQLLSPRPSIDDYDDQARFVADVLAWERHRDQLQQQISAGELRLEKSRPNYHDWHHVTGPEDLDTALNNARGYEQPRYRERYRFNRTTHLSFPLQRLPPEELAREAVEGEPKPVDPSLREEARRLPKQVIDQLDRLQQVAPAPAQPSLEMLPRQVSLSN